MPNAEPIIRLADEPASKASQEPAPQASHEPVPQASQESELKRSQGSPLISGAIAADVIARRQRDYDRDESACGSMLQLFINSKLIMPGGRVGDLLFIASGKVNKGHGYDRGG